MNSGHTDRIIRGLAYVVGDNIDTDQIIPAEYLNLVPTIPEEYEKLGSYAMAGLPDDSPAFVEPGEMKSKFSIIIAGRNFGCGSSREHAPVALGAAGIRVVVAGSYARIFFRNAVATGELFPCEYDTAFSDNVCTGDEVEVDLDRLRVVHIPSKEELGLHGLGPVAEVVDAGGIFEYARKTGMLESK